MVLIDKPANLWRGIEAVGGRLSVTEDIIEFRSHAFNIQSGSLSIKIKDVSGIEKTRTLGIVPNGLKVILRSGVEYKFVVADRNRIASIIEKHQ